jgi:four helix bundle protein
MRRFFLIAGTVQLRSSCGVRDHKTLIAWQRAHRVVIDVMNACEKHWRPSAAASFGQLQRSALSVQLNIPEGYGLKSAGLLRRHLLIAYGSAVETTDLLELLRERSLVPSEDILPTIAAEKEAQALIMGLIRKLGR